MIMGQAREWGVEVYQVPFCGHPFMGAQDRQRWFCQQNYTNQGMVLQSEEPVTLLREKRAHWLKLKEGRVS